MRCTLEEFLGGRILPIRITTKDCSNNEYFFEVHYRTGEYYFGHMPGFHSRRMHASAEEEWKIFEPEKPKVKWALYHCIRRYPEPSPYEIGQVCAWPMETASSSCWKLIPNSEWEE